jgi:hypothetical protein
MEEACLPQTGAHWTDPPWLMRPMSWHPQMQQETAYGVDPMVYVTRVEWPHAQCMVTVGILEGTTPDKSEWDDPYNTSPLLSSSPPCRWQRQSVLAPAGRPGRESAAGSGRLAPHLVSTFLQKLCEGSWWGEPQAEWARPFGRSERGGTEPRRSERRKKKG